jgi:hypothetical protein
VVVRSHSAVVARLRRQGALFCLLTALSAGAPALAAQSASVPHSSSVTQSLHAASAARAAQNKPLLPPSFAGLPRSGDIVIDQTPTTVDPTHAAVLKEDGMVQADRARYGSGASTGWKIQAFRFGDVAGAYAAFTFYRNPQMQPEPVGDDAAAGSGIFLVRSGATLVLVRAEGRRSALIESLLTAMKVLVRGISRIYGPEATAPTVPGLLPHQGLEKDTVQYSLGPAGYSGPLPVGILGFQADAEVASAHYRLYDGREATLTLSMLPTPQLAGELMKDVAAMPDATLHIAGRRYSSLAGIVTGKGISRSDAEALLDKVHYAPQVTIADPVSAGGGPNPVAQMAGLLVGIAEFTVVMAVSAILLAGFFGFGRVYIRRLRGKPDSSLYDEEFITLKLK